MTFIRKKFFPEQLPSLQQFISWGNQQDHFMLLNSNRQSTPSDSYGNYDLLIAAGSLEEINSGNAFQSLNDLQERGDWLFGYLSYDIKNQVEKLSSKNFDGIGAPDFLFFRPKYVIEIKDGKACIHYIEETDDEKSLGDLMHSIQEWKPKKAEEYIPEIQARVAREEYLSAVEGIRKHLARGDIYEMNYCMEFYSEGALIDAGQTYLRLNERSPMPFSAFMHFNSLSLMCASPERFLARRGSKIISQPIKGTARRGGNEDEDQRIAEQLRNDPKEKSENVMIVDLVRNDLSRTAAKGSVVVEELFGVKTFRQLHQLESTVVSKVKEGVTNAEIIRNAFPMGSMTGAPKIRAMEIIEDMEATRRGVYSGTLGYIRPDGDFDFNVIIRSLVYESEKKYLSYMAGSAITYACQAEKEYEECLLKAASMNVVIDRDKAGTLS